MNKGAFDGCVSSTPRKNRSNGIKQDGFIADREYFEDMVREQISNIDLKYNEKFKNVLQNVKEVEEENAELRILVKELNEKVKSYERQITEIKNNYNKIEGMRDSVFRLTEKVMTLSVQKPNEEYINNEMYNNVIGKINEVDRDLNRRFTEMINTLKVIKDSFSNENLDVTNVEPNKSASKISNFATSEDEEVKQYSGNQSVNQSGKGDTLLQVETSEPHTDLNVPLSNVNSNVAKQYSTQNIFTATQSVIGNPNSGGLFGTLNMSSPNTNAFKLNNVDANKGTKTDIPQGNLFGSKSNQLFGQNNFMLANDTSKSNQFSFVFGSKGQESKPGLPNFQQQSDNSGGGLNIGDTFFKSVSKAEHDNTDGVKDVGKVFDAKAGKSIFQNLTANSGSDFGFGCKEEVQWKAGGMLFSTKPANTSQEQEETEKNDDECTAHFEPVLAELPPLIPQSKDEDTYEVLFKSRCKLFRMIDNEWKERGLGEMKVLRTKIEHDPKQRVRLLMRREQVGKICCNHAISKLCPSFKKMTEKSACWFAQDFSESEKKDEKFAIRFGKETLLEEFQKVIAEVQSKMDN